MPQQGLATAPSASLKLTMQKNLEQVRAANALVAVSKGTDPQQGGFERNDVNGLPALIQSCGLLATAAYVSVAGQDGRQGMWNAMDAVARHMRDAATGPLLTETQHGAQINETKVLLHELSERNSGALIRATAEALAFLSYLKRFAPPKP